MLLAPNNLFGDSSQVLATLPRADLVADATGRDFSSPAGFSVTVPAGLASGPITSACGSSRPAVAGRPVRQERRPSRQDWEPLTVVTRPPPARPTCRRPMPAWTAATEALEPGQADTCTFTVTTPWATAS